MKKSKIMKISAVLMSILATITIFASCSGQSQTTYEGKLLSERFIFVSDTPLEDTEDSFKILCDKETRILYLCFFNYAESKECNKMSGITAICPLLGDDGLPQKYKGTFYEGDD